ncbi:MAG: hypothetical protein HRU12_08975 [Phaeodactylibacter sp.]|nr:hypothetical protein [Phaeodactylibacter sp.]
MSLYNQKTTETTVSVTTYDRSSFVQIFNPFNGTPSIHFDEETIRVSQIDGGEVEQASQGRKQGQLKEKLTVDNLTEEFELRDPLTGNLLGTTAQYQDLQVLVFSLYYHLAEKRDG